MRERERVVRSLSVYNMVFSVLGRRGNIESCLLSSSPHLDTSLCREVIVPRGFSFFGALKWEKLRLYGDRQIC